MEIFGKIYCGEFTIKDSFYCSVSSSDDETVVLTANDDNKKLHVEFSKSSSCNVVHKEGLIAMGGITEAVNSGLVSTSRLAVSFPYFLKLDCRNQFYKIILETSNKILDSYVTAGKVTTTQMVFRAITKSKERNMLCNRYVPSKALLRIEEEKWKNNEDEIWMKCSPNLAKLGNTPLNEDVILLMRWLALCKSYEPISQFSSVALDFKTASRFENQGGVYAFEVNPNCQIMGFYTINWLLEVKFNFKF